MARIREVRQHLLHPSPEVLDRCAAELSEVIVALETLVAAGSGNLSPAASRSFHQIRTAARGLRLQIEHASNVCLGWMQMRLATGYSRRGLPVFVEGGAASSFEA